MQSNTKTTSSSGRTTAMANTKLYEFFVQQLQDLYWAEKKLVKTLPKLSQAATLNRLKQAFNDHLEQTITHVSRLENVFQIIEQEPRAVKCPAMAGIVDEGEDIIDDTDTGTAQRDVGLIFAAQKAEHYEIATYGGLVTLARTMGMNEVADILDQTLSEEKITDGLLTKIAEEDANLKASTEKAE